MCRFLSTMRILTFLASQYIIQYQNGALQALLGREIHFSARHIGQRLGSMKMHVIFSIFGPLSVTTALSNPNGARDSLSPLDLCLCQRSGSMKMRDKTYMQLCII